MKAAILAGALALAASLLSANPAGAGTGDWGLHSKADFNGDCAIDVIDLQSVSFRYGAYCGYPLYDPLYDINSHYAPGQEKDCQISIFDIQFVFMHWDIECKEYWDVQTSMGMYSYGSSSTCSSSADYVDPITVIFTGNATADRLKEEAHDHGFPVTKDPWWQAVWAGGEQRFWEIDECTCADVDAAENDGGSLFDWVKERWHFRAEIGAEVKYTWSNWYWRYVPVGGHVTWETFAVATPHFDDDENSCGHFVPQVFPYPEEVYPGFSGSGFDAGREYIRNKFVFEGGHDYVLGWWGNRIAIKQGCGGDQWPQSDGYVYYVDIP